MIDNKLLDANMFSIAWPDENKEGSLTFGGYDESLISGELNPLPLFPSNTTHWQVEMESLFMIGDTDCGGKKAIINKKLPDYKAIFISNYPGIALPYQITTSLIHHLPAWQGICSSQYVVDCDDVPSLPEITIGLKGQNVTLKGEDYTRKMIFQGYCPVKLEECYLMIGVMPIGEKFPQDMVVLGLPFLSKMLGVYDWDNKTVSCESFV